MMAIVCLLLAAACLVFSTSSILGVHAFTAATTTRISSTPGCDGHSCFVSSVIKRNNIINIIPSSISPSGTPTRGAADAGERLALFARNNRHDDDPNDNDNTTNNNNVDKDENNQPAGIANWITSRLERADILEIRRDVILVSCFVLGRYLLYDLTTGQKLVPGFDAQDAIWLTGTLSSAALLGLYWTAAGLLLTRLFEAGRASSLPANAVNVAMCGPLWIATEHALRFGPRDIGGPTLDASVASGFIGLASFMAVMKTATFDWR